MTKAARLFRGYSTHSSQEVNLIMLIYCSSNSKPTTTFFLFRKQVEFTLPTQKILPAEAFCLSSK